MRGRWVIFVILTLVTIGFALVFLTGLDDYWRVMHAIRQLPAERQGVAREEFLTIGEDNLYGGTLAFATPQYIGVWGKRGLRILPLKDGVVYSYFSICAMQNEANNVGRETTGKVGLWREWVKRGQYVTLALESGEGSVAEVYGYDWYVFLPVNREVHCQE
jgi:hypothetical protein